MRRHRAERSAPSNRALAEAPDEADIREDVEILEAVQFQRQFLGLVALLDLVLDTAVVATVEDVGDLDKRGEIAGRQPPVTGKPDVQRLVGAKPPGVPWSGCHEGFRLGGDEFCIRRGSARTVGPRDIERHLRPEVTSI